VTLKRPVKSEEERDLITAKAAEIAGAGNVKNEMDIASKPPQKEANEKQTRTR
jgi:hypothetical protein